MTKVKRERKNVNQAVPQPDKSRVRSRRNLLVIATTFGCAVGAVATGGFVVTKFHSALMPVAVPTSANSITLGTLLTMTPDHLAEIDIARMNLLCARGLPGAEKLDVPTALGTIDGWAAKIKQDTERHLYRLTDPRYADHYGNSEAKFRAEMMVQVLQEDLGVHYNVERVEKIDFTSSKDLFLHGLIDDRNGGTCVSMPVLYTAIARRLGYPVMLVEAKAHLFNRWEGTGPDGRQERFNFEGTGDGFSVFDDKHYENWPKPITADEISRGEYLKSLTPGEELAVFLATRAHCLLDTGKLQDAQTMYAQAHRLRPASRDYFGFFVDSVRREATGGTVAAASWKTTEARNSRDLDAELDRINSINAANRRRMAERWQRTLPGVPPQSFGEMQDGP